MWMRGNIPKLQANPYLTIYTVHATNRATKDLLKCYETDAGVKCAIVNMVYK